MPRSNISSQSVYQSSFSVSDKMHTTTQDDPSKPLDRKEKKRIQNREAQRTYRSRIKARLEDLEARLAPEDRDTFQNIDVKTTRPQSARTIPEPSATTTSGRASSVLLSPQGKSQHEATRFSEPYVRRQDTHKRDIDDMASGHVSAQHTVYEDGLSPSFGASASTASIRSKRRFLDILSSHNDLLVRLDQFQQEVEATEDLSHVNKDVTALPNLSWGEVPDLDPWFLLSDEQTPTIVPTLEDLLEDSESWVRQIHHLPTSRLGETSVPNNSLTPLSLASCDSQSGTRTLSLHPEQLEFISCPENSLSQTEQFESILEHISKLGFEHFDEIALKYWTEEFDQSSFIANEQRTSRTRRLPAVLAKLFSATASWSEWDRRSLYEEIITTTETLLLSEIAARGSTLDEKLFPLIEGCIKDQLTFHSASASMRAEIENSLPILWTLMMALMQGNRGVKPNERSKVAMATVLLLNYAGRMGKSQLLNILGAFLL